MPRSSSQSIQQNTTPIKISEYRSLPASIPRPSFFQTMKEGVALGVGSSIGHRIVGALMGSPIVQRVDKITHYEQCIKDNNIGCEDLLGTKY